MRTVSGLRTKRTCSVLPLTVRETTRRCSSIETIVKLLALRTAFFVDVFEVYTHMITRARIGCRLFINHSSLDYSAVRWKTAAGTAAFRQDGATFSPEFSRRQRLIWTAPVRYCWRCVGSLRRDN